MQRETATTGPLSWSYGLFVLFGAAQLAAGVIMFFAYNWRDLPDLAKIALPQAAMALSFLVFGLSPKISPLGQAAGALAIVLIGVAMAVVGQVYQMGADPWGLFALWAAFALPLALIARSDAYLAICFAVASTAFTLWAEQVARPRYGLDERAIPAIYAALAASVLLLRDFAGAAVAGPAPRWQRWFFAFCALSAATSAGAYEVFARPIFPTFYGTASLFGAALAFYGLYRWPRPDRPARSLALFALAIWFGALGLRFIFDLNADGAGGFTVMLLMSAAWVIAVTAALARLLQNERPRA